MALGSQAQEGRVVRPRPSSAKVSKGENYASQNRADFDIDPKTNLTNSARHPNKQSDFIES
jgi:hypothetical protein